jgi:hypothetical protein
VLLLVSCSAISSTLKIEIICSSETSGFLRTTQRDSSGDCTVERLHYKLKCPYLQSYNVYRTVNGRTVMALVFRVEQVLY